jgi:hypothetical protein
MALGAGWAGCPSVRANQKLAALTVAGSVGTGLADRFSDLELDCYWLAPPSDLDRLGPIREIGGGSETHLGLLARGRGVERRSPTRGSPRVDQ